MLYCHLLHFPFWILKVRNVIWRTEYSIKTLHQCGKIAKFTTQHKIIIRFGLIVLLFKSLNVFNLPAATRNLIINHTFFVNLLMAGVFIYSFIPIIYKLVHSFAEQINGWFLYDGVLRHERVRPRCFFINLRN